MARVINSARKASETGVAFVLERQESKWLMDAISLADVVENKFSGYKSLLIYLLFKGGGGEKNVGSSYLEGCLNVDAATIKRLKFTGRIRWQCYLQGLSLDLFSDSAANSFGGLLDDPDELGRKHREIIDGYWKDRERIKQERKAETSRFPTPLPKYITSVRVKRCLESDETRTSHRPDDTRKDDSSHSNDQSPVDQSDDLDDKIDDRFVSCNTGSIGRIN